MDFGAVLDAGDYAIGAGLLDGNIGTAANSLAIGYRSVDATASVIADRAAARPHTEFRIRTTLADTNTDACDYVNWEDGENSYLPDSRRSSASSTGPELDAVTMEGSNPMRLHLLVVGILLCTVSCGGHGHSGPASTAVTVTIVSSGAIDGIVLNDGTVDTLPIESTGDTGCAPPPIVTIRAFFHFDISAIPPPSAILSAVFEPYQVNTGGDPIVAFGPVIAEHVDFGAVLDAADFGDPPIAPAFAVVSSSLTPGPRPVDATAEVVADRVALRPYSEFRLRHATGDLNGDGVCDRVDWEDGDGNGGSGFLPVLRITYQP